MKGSTKFIISMLLIFLITSVLFSINDYNKFRTFYIKTKISDTFTIKTKTKKDNEYYFLLTTSKNKYKIKVNESEYDNYKINDKINVSFTHNIYTNKNSNIVINKE